MTPSKTRRASTRVRNANAQPGDPIPKQTRRTSEQVKAAKEAEKAAKKKKEAERKQKLTNVAQAADNTALEMQAHESMEPRTRPNRPLKRTYAMLDVTDTEELACIQKETESTMSESDTDEQSDTYKPSETSPGSEDTMDPASQSDASEAAKPLPKKKRRSKKTSVLAEIQAQRQHLGPIEESVEGEVDEEEQGAMPVGNLKHVLPFKAGLKKSWAAQKELQQDEASNTSKSVKAKPSESARARPPSPADSDHDIPKTPLQVQPRPRPRPRGRPHKAQFSPKTPQILKSPSPLTGLQDVGATPVNNGKGIPEDESDSEERAAAKSSPIKAGKRITSNSIITIQPTSKTGPPASKAGPTASLRMPFPQANQAAQEPIKRQLTASKQTTTRPQQNSNTGVTDDHDLYTFGSDWDAEELNHKSESVNVGTDNQPSITATAPSRKPTKPKHPKQTTDVHLPSQTVTQSGVPKPKNKLSKPTKPLPDVVEEPDAAELEREVESEPEPEPDDDRASVAPSEGNPGHAIRRSRGAGRSPAPKYDCLPSAVPHDTFKEVYVPTVIKYLGKLSNAWSTSTVEYVHVIQSVWNEIFPKVPYTFSAYGPRCAVIALIAQRTYEWRGKFASAAVDAVLDMELREPSFQDVDYRTEWIAWATEESVWPFLYADTVSENSEDWSGTFASTLITQAFAPHLMYMANAIVVKKLKDLESKQPSAALGLATVAVERALSAWDDGLLKEWRQLREKDRPTLPKFDTATWNLKTQSWLTAIATLDTKSWNEIINEARKHIKPTSRKQISSAKVANNIDTRALLVARPRRK